MLGPALLTVSHRGLHQLGKTVLLCGLVGLVNDARQSRGLNEILFRPCGRMYWRQSSGIQLRVLEGDKRRGLCVWWVLYCKTARNGA